MIRHAHCTGGSCNVWTPAPVHPWNDLRLHANLEGQGAYVARVLRAGPRVRRWAGRVRQPGRWPAGCLHLRGDLGHPDLRRLVQDQRVRAALAHQRHGHDRHSRRSRRRAGVAAPSTRPINIAAAPEAVRRRGGMPVHTVISPLTFLPPPTPSSLEGAFLI